MFSRVTVLLFQALLYPCATQAETNSTLNMTETLNILFHGYDKFTPPALSEGDDDGPVIVNICVNIKDVFDISALDSSFSARYYFTLQWHDERLRYSPYLKNEKLMKGSGFQSVGFRKVVNINLVTFDTTSFTIEILPLFISSFENKIEIESVLIQI